MRAFFRPRENIDDANWIHLTEDEEVLWVGRPSRMTILLSLVIGLLLVVIGLLSSYWLIAEVAAADLPWWMGYLPVIFSIVGILWVAIVYLNWLRLLYVITDEEIYVKYGLISRDVTQVRLDRVQNTTFDQSMLQRIFRFGHVNIYTAGSSTEDITFTNVPRPERLTRMLTNVLSDQANREPRRDQQGT